MNSILLIIGTLIGVSSGCDVKIKSVQWGYYLNCQGDHIVGSNQATVFKLEEHSGFFALKAPNGKYVSAQQGLSYNQH